MENMTPTRHARRSLVLKSAMVSAKATKVATRVREYIYQMAQINPQCTEVGSERAAITDPYRPEVAPTTTNDIPFIVKSGEEFPTERGLTRSSVKWWGTV